MYHTGPKLFIPEADRCQLGYWVGHLFSIPETAPTLGTISTYFPCCCHQMPEKGSLQGGRVHHGSELESNHPSQQESHSAGSLKQLATLSADRKLLSSFLPFHPAQAMGPPTGKCSITYLALKSDTEPTPTSCCLPRPARVGRSHCSVAFPRGQIGANTAQAVPPQGAS